MRFRGSAFGVMLTPLAALGVIQAHWELDAASARFARLEIREPHRRPLATMVAMTNPIWLA